MAIIHQTGDGEGLTGGSRALDLFTDREQAIRQFLSALNDDPPPPKIFFFTGDGGNGKSVLLRTLCRHYCRRLDNRDDWAWVKAQADDDCLGQVRQAENAAAVPFAFLDFGMPPRGDDRPQEAFSALLMLMRGLSGHGLRFPLYEFACVWYLHKTDRLTSEKLRELFPADMMDFITELASTVANTSWAYLANSILRIFDSQMSERYTLYQYQRGVSADRIAEIQRMEPESELIDNLPRLWAEDLNAALAPEDAPDRVVLLFDTHEAFWGRERDLTDDLYFQYDEWLRCLLANLELSSGIVSIVAGRERPRWARAARYRIPDEFLEVIPIGHFSDRDAHRYLGRAGVKDAGLRRALVSRARVKKDEVHPFYLGLCADMVETAARRGTPLTAADFPQHERGKALIDRLLRYVDAEVGAAVRALCACRSFDREIFVTLGKELGFAATESRFEVLCGFSFVWQSRRGGEGWHRIHDLLSRLVREGDDAIVRRADAVLERYYEARARAGEPEALAEAIFHANMRDAERGAQRWVEAFDDALRSSRFPVCRALIEVWTDLRLESDFARGRVLDAQGDYFAKLSDHEEAQDSYESAIVEFDQALARDPNDAAAHVNRGNSLLSLGELQATLARHAEAQTSTLAAIAAFARALDLAPEDPAGWVNSGNAHQRLGRLQAALGRPDEALESHRRAEAAYAEALRRAPDDVATWNNAGNAWQARAELLAALERGDDAQESFRRAIDHYGEALRRAPEFIPSLIQRGNALALLGDLHERFGRFEEALTSTREAIAAYAQAIALAPEDAAARNNAGNAWQGLGEIEIALGRREDAAESYRRAIDAYAEALRRAPEYAAAHHNSGVAELGLARLESAMGRSDAALASCRNAIAAHHEALLRTPENFLAHHGKGLALLTLSELEVGLGKPEDALRNLRKAVTSFDKALRRAPAHVPTFRCKGDALQGQGELYMAAGRTLDARRAYRRAVNAYEKALKLAPEDAQARSSRENALQDLAEVEREMGEDAEE